MTAKGEELQYIESNPRVCHGQWVFKGTRIMVWVVREQLQRGMTPEQVVGQWRGDVSLAAIDEVLRSQVKDPEFPIDSD